MHSNIQLPYIYGINKKQMRYIYLLLIAAAPFLCMGQTAIQGKIVDKESRQPVVGANIYLQNNTGVGTTSQSNGYFTLKVPSAHIWDSLVISCIGYKKTTIAISGTTKSLTIYLTPSAESIDEVVIKKDQGAKLVLKKAFRKYYKNVYYGWYTASMIQTSLLYDSTNRIIDATRINGCMISADFDAQSDTITPKQGSPTFYALEHIKTSNFNADLYQHPIHLKPKGYMGCSAASGDAGEVMNNYFFLTLLFPNVCFNNYFPDFKSHINFAEKEGFYNEREVWVIAVKSLTEIDYDYNLPEPEFRKKHRKDLKQYKKSINYTPINTLFALTEEQIDSLYFSNLRKKMKRGNETMRQVTYYVDKKSYAIHRMDVRITSRKDDTSFYYTNLTYHYADVSLHRNRTKKILGKVEITSNTKQHNTNIYTAIEMKDFNLRNSFRANYCQCVDSIAPEINNSIDSYIDNWEVVSQSPIFRVDNELFN